MITEMGRVKIPSLPKLVESIPSDRSIDLTLSIVGEAPYFSIDIRLNQPFDSSSVVVEIDISAIHCGSPDPDLSMLALILSVEE